MKAGLRVANVPVEHTPLTGLRYGCCDVHVHIVCTVNSECKYRPILEDDRHGFLSAVYIGGPDEAVYACR